MRKNTLLTILFSLIIISTLCGTGITPSIVQSVTAKSSTIYVPDIYDTIQKAVNAANPGDTIIVRPGIYSENVFLNKTLTLIGEDRNATIMDGNSSRNVIHILSPNVAIINFTVQNSGNNLDDSGILLFGAVNTTIRNNIIKNNNIGVHLRHGSNNTLIIDNLILNNTASGIRLADNNNFNYIIGNTLMNNTIGVEVHASSLNTFYHNNFIHNKVYQVQILGGVSNRWDDGVEGNYWSDYGGSDVNGDGIGDTELPSWVDYYPLIEPWSLTRVFHVELEEEIYHITVQSNSTVASFDFSHSLRQISFRITGPSGMTFYCNVSVPKPLLNATPSENWLVQLNNTDISAKSTITENTHTSIYFTYSLSTYEVRIRVVKVGVVNFTPYIIGCGVAVAIAVISTMTFIMLKKKKKH
jgi:parallel beta-helix repeat protein